MIKKDYKKTLKNIKVFLNKKECKQQYGHEQYKNIPEYAYRKNIAE